MKKFIITAVIVALFASGSALNAQDRQENYLGLPGDNLDLYAVMHLFQQSKTLEEFEKSLNDPNTNINNLDLNGDNQVDYIRVMDNIDGDVHNIVLQVAISPRENQDVAVFTVQRFNNGTVQIQLTGDEELYGKNYIVEPIYDTPNPGYTGGDAVYIATTPAQVAVWPVVRFIYLPTYVRWHSNWYWGYYPSYWRPWQPVSWHYYYGYQSNWDQVYYRHYRMSETHFNGYHDYYYVGRRTYSPEVSHRITTGVYRTSYSHPDDMRGGEEKFAKSHPEQYKTIHSTNSSVRPYTNINSNRSNSNDNSSDRRNNGSTRIKNDNSGRPNGNDGVRSNGNGRNNEVRSNGNKNDRSKENNGVRSNGNKNDRSNGNNGVRSNGNNNNRSKENNSDATRKPMKVNPTRTDVSPSVNRTNETSKRSEKPAMRTNTSPNRSTVTSNPSNQNVRKSTETKRSTVSSPNRSSKQTDKSSAKERKNTDSKGDRR